MEFLIIVDIFFNISLRTGNLLSRQIFTSKSTNQLDFFANKLIYFKNKLPNQIKNRNSVKEKLRLDWRISEKMLTKEFNRVFLVTIWWIT